jgi:hypothetical protein
MVARKAAFGHPRRRPARPRHVAPAFGISVLQPNESSADVGRAVPGVVNHDRLFAPSWHEDFHSSVVIALGPLVQRALNASELVEGVSQKMLTQTLRHMEHDSLITNYDVTTGHSPR